VVLLEHLGHEPVRLAQVQEPLVGRHDAGRVLPAVLQHAQRVVDQLGRRLSLVREQHGHDPAHVCEKAGFEKK
jgi:hypothetical protein